MTPAPEGFAEALADRYRIERQLGEGGMATVYLARDLRHDRRVAVKILKPGLASAHGAERFLAEIRTTARLRHPHILPLFDSGEVAGHLFYVMPFVDGESLRARLEREKQLPVDEALRIAGDAADALAFAHDAGIVHRDVKPENILLEGGHAFVCDFGIAKALDQAGHVGLTEVGLALGTAAYMSPEQAASSGPVDGRADIYALGCVLYEMLTGSPPFLGSTPQAILARKAMEAPPHLRVVRDTVPIPVEAAVEQALARVPADRFTDARAFAGALRSGPGAPVRRGRGRGRWKLVAGLAAGLALVALVEVLARYRSRERPLPAFTFARLTASPGVEDSPSLSPDGQWVAYAGEGPEGRDVFLQGIGGQTPINLTATTSEDDEQPAFSPDGTQLAFRSNRDGGGLFVMGRTGEAVRRVSKEGYNPAWSPDGTTLVYASEGVGLLPLNWLQVSALWTVELATGATRRIFDGDAVQPSWSPNGRRIAYTARMAGESQGRMDIWTLPAEGGDPVAVTSDEAADWGATWSADGRWLYFSSTRGGSQNLWRVQMDQDTGRRLGEPEPLTTPASFAAHPAVSAAQDVLVYTALQQAENIEGARLDWQAGVLDQQRWLTTGSQEWSSPDPSPDGRYAVFYSRNLPEGDLYIAPTDGSTRPRQLTSGVDLDRVPRWSPDGAWILYFSNRSPPLRPWVIRPDGSDNHNIGGDGYATFGAWAPDASRVAVNGSAKMDSTRVLVVDPSRAWNNQRVDTLPRPDSFAAQVNDWSPDGRLLAALIAPLSDLGILTYSFEAGTWTRLTDFGQWPVWMPDSRHILFVTRGREFWIVDAVTGETRLLHRFGTLDVVCPPRVSRDGGQVVYTRRASEADLWVGRLR